MGMRPDDMEQWGVVAVFKESARLLYNYRRLFLPFYLAFYLTGALVGIFQIVLHRVASAPPVPYQAGFFMGFRTFRIEDYQGGRELVASKTVSVVVNALGTVGLGAVTYIVAYIYGKEDFESDPDGGGIVKNVFKLLPHAFLRLWVTQLWGFLLLFVFYLVDWMLDRLVTAILSAAVGPMNPSPIEIPQSGVVLLSLLLAFSQSIAVLEPANYGLEAVKRSKKLLKAGDGGTILAVVIIGITFTLILMFPAETMVLGAFLAVLNSVFSVYAGVVSVVMYFVYASRLNAAMSSIPDFNTASPENPCKPLVQPGNAVS